MKTNNWLFIGYDKNGKQIESFEIKDRTEHEANSECMSYVENVNVEIDDWTLTKI